MRFQALFTGLTILTVACGALTGCSTSPSGTDLEPKKPLTQDEQKALNKQIMEGMKGYKGAPGHPMKTR
jgi:hypothetical protein